MKEIDAVKDRLMVFDGVSVADRETLLLEVGEKEMLTEDEKLRVVEGVVVGVEVAVSGKAILKQNCWLMSVP